jgi:beta-lactamase class A
MCSTFKWILAASILSLVEQGKVTLDRRIPFGPADMMGPDFVAPVTRAHLKDGSLTVGELCAAAVEESDNVAANLLLALSGGPAALTEFIRRQGDAITRLDRNEPTLNTNLPGDPRDTTTPDAMVGLMAKVLTGDALSPASRDQLIGWMKDCRTGLARLRAGLPPGWTAGDKTGTGDNGAVNDLAIVWSPGRKPILAASYFSGSKLPAKTLNAAHAEIGGVVAAAFG